MADSKFDAVKNIIAWNKKQIPEEPNRPASLKQHTIEVFRKRDNIKVKINNLKAEFDRQMKSPVALDKHIVPSHSEVVNNLSTAAENRLSELKKKYNSSADSVLNLVQIHKDYMSKEVSVWADNCNGLKEEIDNELLVDEYMFEDISEDYIKEEQLLRELENDFECKKMEIKETIENALNS